MDMNGIWEGDSVWIGIPWPWPQCPALLQHLATSSAPLPWLEKLTIQSWDASKPQNKCHVSRMCLSHRGRVLFFPNEGFDPVAAVHLLSNGICYSFNRSCVLFDSFMFLRRQNQHWNYALSALQRHNWISRMACMSAWALLWFAERPKTATFGWSKQESCFYANTDGCTKNKVNFNQQIKARTTQPANQPNRHQSKSVFGEVPSACRHRSLHSAEPAQRNPSQPRSTSAAGCVQDRQGRGGTLGNRCIPAPRNAYLRILRSKKRKHWLLQLSNIFSTKSSAENLRPCRMGVIGQLRISGRPNFGKKAARRLLSL